MSHEFKVNDSGKREEFAGGMVRDTQEGKILWHLTASGPMLKRYAIHLTKGAVKYGEDNWLKAVDFVAYLRFKSSAYRHFMQWFFGDVDEDHAAAVIFNINGAEMVKEKMDEVKQDTVRIEEDEVWHAERESRETPKQRKARLWADAGKPYVHPECDGRIQVGAKPSSGYWACELPEGHTGKHSAPGYCEDW